VRGTFLKPSFKRFSSCLLLVCLLALSFPTSSWADSDGLSVGIGGEWISEYQSKTGYPNLYTADDCVRGLKDIVNDPNTSWIWDFEWYNTAAWEEDWKRTGLGGTDIYWVDDVDLAAWCGHGPKYYFLFTTYKDDDRLYRSEPWWGDKDVEWVLLFTCHYLNFDTGTWSGWSTVGQMAKGVHVVCGYKTDMTIISNGGSRFAYYARNKYPVRSAWGYYFWDTQDPSWNNVARCFYHYNCRNDRLWGYGSVSSDPPSFSSDSSNYWITDYYWQ
jgi:hypothetical protein